MRPVASGRARVAPGDPSGGVETLVSIVTPCLNPGDRLLRCLESVASQSYARIEHVVVDGGSTDGTVERLQAMPGITWRSEPDRGQADAINKGFDLATGSILSWLNADDVLLPDAVERAVRLLDASPGTGLVFGSCRVVRDGHEDLTWKPPRRLSSRVLETGSSIPQPGAFFARWALERAGPLDESFSYAMDVDLWLRMLGAGVANRRIPGVVSVFEVHAASKTGSVPRKLFYAETARALARAGLTRAAAVALGQGAATAAFESGATRRVDQTRLADEIRVAEEEGLRLEPPLAGRMIAAAARAEAAVIELRSSGSGLRHLLTPDVWREREVRRRLRDAVRRGGPRLVSRLVGDLKRRPPG